MLANGDLYAWGDGGSYQLGTAPNFDLVNTEQTWRAAELDVIVKDAVDMKYTSAPLTKDQLAELIQIPPRR